MPNVIPFLWFSGEAEEAAQFYVSIFKNSRITEVMRYSEAGPGPTGSVMLVEFELDGKPFKAINAFSDDNDARSLEFAQGKIALYVDCEGQSDVDELWEKLSDGGHKMPCGWVQDRYGFAWNIVPSGLSDVLAGPDEARSQRAMQAMLNMSKLDIDELRRVYAA